MVDGQRRQWHLAFERLWKWGICPTKHTVQTERIRVGIGMEESQSCLNDWINSFFLKSWDLLIWIAFSILMPWYSKQKGMIFRGRHFINLRACFFAFKGDLKARHQMHRLQRWYQCNLPPGKHIQTTPFCDSNFWFMDPLFKPSPTISCWCNHRSPI